MIGFDSLRDRQWSHSAPYLDDILHIVHADWHGIRSATASVPGHKLTIPHDRPLDGESLRHLYGIIYKYDIRRICIQGYSPTADSIAGDIKQVLGEDVKIYVITHVNSAQFEYSFEIDMQSLILDRFRSGVFSGLGSVKPRFSATVDGYWPKTIINAAPNLPVNLRATGGVSNNVFVPVENTWRKNLYTNILAAINVQELTAIHTVNWPAGIDKIADVRKVKLVGYKRGLDLLTTMARSVAVLAVTLAECQPMTQLESLAVGTPCLTGPLLLDEFAGHELVRLCETPAIDNPGLIAEALRRLVALRTTDSKGLADLIDDYLRLRTEVCFASYAEFLGLA